VIVLADAETIEQRADDRYMGDTVRGQLAGADIIVLNKVDLVSSERAAAISRWLAGIAPGPRTVPAEKADIPAEIVIGGRPEPRWMAPRLQPPRHRTADYETLSLELDSPLDAERLGRILADPRLGLLRTKGFLRGSDGAFVTLHVVGRRSQVEPAPSWIEGPGRLICIGFAAEMDRASILAAIKAWSPKTPL